MNSEKQTQDDNPVNGYATSQTSLDAISNSITPQRKPSNSGDLTQNPPSFSPENFQNMFQLLFDKLQLGTPTSQP